MRLRNGDRLYAIDGGFLGYIRNRQFVHRNGAVSVLSLQYWEERAETYWCRIMNFNRYRDEIKSRR